MNPDKHMWIRLAAVALVAVGLMGLGACTERMDVMVGPFDEQGPSDGGEPASDAGLDADSGAPKDAVADTEVVDVTEDVAKDTKESDGIASGHRCIPGKEPRGGCKEGLVCLSDEYGGVCAKPCQIGERCDNGGRCLSLRNGESTPQSTNFCTHQCEPWDPGACGDQAGCREVICDKPGKANGISRCAAQTGTGGSGESCNSDDDCKPGWHCIGEKFRKKCRKPCRLDEGDTDCSADDSGFVHCGSLLLKCNFAGNKISLCRQ